MDVIKNMRVLNKFDTNRIDTLILDYIDDFNLIIIVLKN